MSSGTFRTWGLILGALGTLGVTPPAHAGDVGHPSSFSSTVRSYYYIAKSCVVDGPNYSDVIYGKGDWGTRTSQSFFDPSHDWPTCEDFTYVKLPLTNRRYDSVTPYFAGPDIDSSAFDCSHSSLFYLVMKRYDGGSWVPVAAGQLWGDLQGSYCSHNTPNHWLSEWFGPGSQAPVVTISDGPRGTTTSWDPDDFDVVGEIKVLTFSWAHNDTDIGHPGNLCSTDNCYYGSRTTRW